MLTDIPVVSRGQTLPTEFPTCLVQLKVTTTRYEKDLAHYGEQLKAQGLELERREAELEDKSDTIAEIKATIEAAKDDQGVLNKDNLLSAALGAPLASLGITGWKRRLVMLAVSTVTGK